MMKPLIHPLKTKRPMQSTDSVRPASLYFPFCFTTQYTPLSSKRKPLDTISLIISFLRISFQFLHTRIFPLQVAFPPPALDDSFPILVQLKVENPTVCCVVNPQAASPGQSTTARGIQASLFCSLILPPSPHPPKKGKINFNQRAM